MNPEAKNPPTNEAYNAINQAEATQLTMNPEAESANNEGSNAINRQPPLITNNKPQAESANKGAML
jgi:hypothetical protein